MYIENLRILIVDDSLYNTISNDSYGTNSIDDINTSRPRFYRLFDTMRKDDTSSQVTVHLSTTVPFYNPDTRKLAYLGKDTILELNLADMDSQGVPSCKLDNLPDVSNYDLLILDLDGVGRGTEALDTKTLSKIASKIDAPTKKLEYHVKNLNEHFPGASWYLNNIDKNYLNVFEQIFIISNYDRQRDSPDGSDTYEDDKQEAFSSLEIYLHKLCDPLVRWQGFPPTRKYAATDDDDLKRAGTVARQMLEDRIEGLDYLPRGREVESASFHDLPVLIIGENETGRDRIAEGITRRWLHRRAEKNNLKPFELPRSPKRIDCTGLSSDQAHAKLFGQIRQLSSPRRDHFQLGAILQSIGLTSLPKEGDPSPDLSESETRKVEDSEHLGTVYAPQGDTIERFTDSALSIPKLEVDHHSKGPTPGHVSHEPNLRVANKAGWGVVYLHEFHNLPRSVQDALLRFLRTKRIHPNGFSGSIRVPRVRIIASSSHPRIGEALGINPPLWKSLPALDNQPVSEDLLLALKGRIIRSRSVSAANVSDIIQRELSNRDEDIEWTSSAYKEIRRQLKKIDPEGRSDDEPIPLFGQHQEVKRLVTLAHAFIAERETRGSRSAPQKVTDTVIRRIWGEAVVPGYSEAAIPWDRDDFMNAVSKKSPAAWAFFEGATRNLDQYWDWGELKEEINGIIDKHDLTHAGDRINNPLGPHRDKLSNIAETWWDKFKLDRSGHYLDTQSREDKIGIIEV
jgi:hypothetical protein